MRILFDSKKSIYKAPFGTLTPGQSCRLQMHVPISVGTSRVECVLCRENGEEFSAFPLFFAQEEAPYTLWSGEFSLETPGLFFYYFRITGNTGTFRLFKQGNDTNMEAGDLWQVSCIPEDFHTPDWAKGCVLYQIFPDRFYKSGNADVSEKLEPYTVHENWDEEVVWQPTPTGEVLNNDFFGGNFRGIAEKLPYLAELGVEAIYLNPITKSFSNHRYDTGNYKAPDPMLGTEEDFKILCEKAHTLGIRIILDGVFSHTGSNSLYFNKESTFDSLGAYQSPDSPYASWYTFYQYPDSYNSWWGFDTLPTVNKLDPAFMDYIITAEDSVIAYWLGLGADGFRLDVADELPDAFIAALKKRLRQLKPDALLIGEVWEDASNKISYGQRRRYFVDGELDSIMNYPFRKAILAYVRQEDDGQGFAGSILQILENYPQEVLHSNLNLLGSHDTPRILTALADNFDGDRQALSQRFLTPEQLSAATQKLEIAAFLQFMLPGCPCIYYADEVGMQGHKDPFNRRTYPWGKENRALLSHYKSLGAVRKNQPALRLGSLEFFQGRDGLLGFTRQWNGESLQIYVNLSGASWDLPAGEILLAKGLSVSPRGQSLDTMGFCLMKG